MGKRKSPEYYADIPRLVCSPGFGFLTVYVVAARVTEHMAAQNLAVTDPTKVSSLKHPVSRAAKQALAKGLVVSLCSFGQLLTLSLREPMGTILALGRAFRQSDHWKGVTPTA